MKSGITNPAFWEEMTKSIFSNDLLILFAAFITFIFGVIIYFLRGTVKKMIDKASDESIWLRMFCNSLNRFYNIFLTLISIFPLLGMLGTVVSLINLNSLEMTENLDNVKLNFFSALTSTAWGIIFSIIFKIVNAFVFYDIDDVYDEYLEKKQNNKSSDNSDKK